MFSLSCFTTFEMTLEMAIDVADKERCRLRRSRELVKTCQQFWEGNWPFVALPVCRSIRWRVLSAAESYAFKVNWQ